MGLVGSAREGREVSRRRTLVEALDREVDLRRTFVAARSEALTTKASILVASASLVTALQDLDVRSTWIGVAIAASALAAVLGIVVLLPRVGEEVNIADTEENLWNEREVEAIRGLMIAKRAILEKDQKALWWRAAVIAAGFAALALSLVIAALVFLQVLPK
jgi:hypothetical protein